MRSHDFCFFVIRLFCSYLFCFFQFSKLITSLPSFSRSHFYLIWFGFLSSISIWFGFSLCLFIYISVKLIFHLRSSAALHYNWRSAYKSSHFIFLVKIFERYTPYSLQLDDVVDLKVCKKKKINKKRLCLVRFLPDFSSKMYFQSVCKCVFCHSSLKTTY